MPTRTLALLAALPGLDFPSRLIKAFAEAGFECANVALEALLAEPGRADALGVLWIGADWERGFETLERLPAETIRRNTVLVGADPPGNVGPRIRRSGGLTFLHESVPGWLLPILVETVARSRREHPLAILGVLRSLSEGVDEDPYAVLKSIAEVGGLLLHAERAFAAILPPEGGGFQVLMDSETGVVPQPWVMGKEAREPPGGLSECAVETREIVVVSDVAWSRVSRVLSGYAYYAAGVSVPVRATFDGLVGPDAPLAATINLFWVEPFLPTAGEMRILDVLAALAAATLLRIGERHRLATAHVASTAALAALPRVFGSGEAERFGVSHSLNTEVREFVRRTLRAHGGCPQLQALWVKVSPATRGESSWISLGAPAALLRPPVDDAALAAAGAQVVPSSGASWALVLPIGGGQPRMGELVAIFRTRAGAAMALGDLRSLVSDLELGVRMIRRAADSGGVVRLSRMLARDEAPGQVLLEMVSLVRERMSSDGCRVFVVRQTAEGARVTLLATTAGALAAADLGPIRPDRGLLDWVLTHGDWLAVNAAQPESRTGQDPEQGVTGQNGPVSVVARARRAADAAAMERRGERVRCLIPLYSLDRVAGVLEVWRTSEHPYDIELDVASLLHFAPHVASAAHRVLQLETVQAELRAISTLTRQMTSANRISEATGSLLAEVGTLASAQHAVLLLHDPSRPGHLFFAGAWSSAAGAQPALEAALRGVHVDCWTEPDDWGRQISEVFPDFLDRAGLGAFRFRQLLPLPRGPAHWPLGAVAFLERPSDTLPYAPFAQDLSEHVARSFLPYAGALLADQIRALAMRTVEPLGGPSEEAAGGAQQVLAHAARLLQEATGANAVLVYAGEGADVRIVASLPALAELDGVPAQRGSLTAAVVEDGRPVRVLDVEDPRDPNQRRMDKQMQVRVLGAFGWKRGRSWMALPVVHEGRSLGLIKVLTSHDGPFLGPYAEEIGIAVARRAAWEISKVRRRLMLEELNAEAEQLATLEGAALNDALISRLSGWIARYVRPSCGVVIIARAARERLLVEVGSPNVPPELLPKLELLSREGARRALSWRAGLPVVVAEGVRAPPLPLAGLAEPLLLPGDTVLEGHLILLHAEPFEAEARPVAREAAREVSLLLNGERLRQEWVLRAGLFRHAFLGPAQGLASAARMLSEIATRVEVPDARVPRLRARVEAESENIRLWRENQRLYMGSNIDIRPRNQPLRRVVESCVDRYRSFLEKERGVTLRIDWREKGAIEFSFDAEALDLALSNLLDNAQKYVFFNREVTVGVATDNRFVHLWVEDVGHGIPERLKDEVYRIGRRIDWEDPLRPINGQGLGLPMAKAVVEAHGGTLSHTCEPEGGGPEAQHHDRQPYRVRFTIKLPHHWTRRRP